MSGERACPDIEIVLPYGNPSASLHYRFGGDRLTLCGRNSEGWTRSEATQSEALNSAYTCKRCKAAYLR